MKMRLAACIAIAGLLAPPAVHAQSSDGVRWYAYGNPGTTIYCRPLYLSDIILEPGETIMTVALGDAARWIVARGASGPHGDTPHVFVKPGQFATNTNLEILTDRHEYLLRLVNDERQYTARVAFYHPESRLAASHRSPPPVARRSDTQQRSVAAISRPTQPSATPTVSAASSDASMPETSSTQHASSTVGSFGSALHATSNATVATEATSVATDAPQPAIKRSPVIIEPGRSSHQGAATAPPSRPEESPPSSAMAMIPTTSPATTPVQADYVSAGPITVTHDAKHTYVSVHSPLAGQPLVFSEDLAGRALVATQRRGTTYALRGVREEVSVWVHGADRAYAVRGTAIAALATPAPSPTPTAAASKGHGRRVTAIQTSTPAPSTSSLSPTTPIAQARERPPIGSYVVGGPIKVTHDARHTYLSVGRELGATDITVTSDRTGRNFMHPTRSGRVYVMRGVKASLFVWQRAFERAYAILRTRTTPTAANGVVKNLATDGYRRNTTSSQGDDR